MTTEWINNCLSASKQRPVRKVLLFKQTDPLLNANACYQRVLIWVLPHEAFLASSGVSALPWSKFLKLAIAGGSMCSRARMEHGTAPNCGWLSLCLQNSMAFNHKEIEDIISKHLPMSLLFTFCFLCSFSCLRHHIRKQKFIFSFALYSSFVIYNLCK